MTKTDTRYTGAGRTAGYYRRACLAACAFLSMTLSLTTAAGPREQAKRMHDRLTGVPPTTAVLDRMEAEIRGGNPEAAAFIAMDGPNNPNARYFYDVTLKNFATPWTNEAQDLFAPLNDYSATVIGMIRDDVPFNQLFSIDYVYAGSGYTGAGVPPVSPLNNDHYEQLEATGADLSDASRFQPVSQVTAVGLPDASAAAGVLTTRAAARAFFIDGTNRAMFRFTLLNHLCTDLEQIKDNTRATDRVRQDVSRSPGGDSRIFMNACVGCHSGMDPMVQAFAYYDYVYPDGNEDGGRLVYTPGQVQSKYLINSDNFKSGYVTTDDHWDNYWREGPNSALGWDSSRPSGGRGARSMGEELANSTAFGQCQATKVFRAVCLRDPDRAEAAELFATYTTSGSRMKAVFAKAATQCMGP